ncbi:hypothetical protein Dip510_001579 [Elusimicrobium posterum]|uniref:HNH endonuclease n=1 Tax=Elusimicrobium posterum TaxID=3116653 RepID=UPI003C7521D9
MPITKERKKLYPENWAQISAQVKILAGNKCEVCDAMNGKPHPITKSKVVLTVHHMDFNPQNNLEYNLIALCQRCHIRLDAKYKAWKRKAKKLHSGGLVLEKQEDWVNLPKPLRIVAAHMKIVSLKVQIHDVISQLVTANLKEDLELEELEEGEVVVPLKTMGSALDKVDIKLKPGAGIEGLAEEIKKAIRSKK